MNRNLIIGGTLSDRLSMAALVSFVWTPFDHTVHRHSRQAADPQWETGLARITLAATFSA